MLENFQLHDEYGSLSRSLSDAGEILYEGYRKINLPTYAVMDGGCFVNLPKTLDEEGIYCRSLFLDHPDSEITRAAAWFVSIENDHMMTKLLGLPGATSATVFWSCNVGDDRLFRHLRSINQIIIPNDLPTERSENSNQSESVSGDQTVMFRHFDPEVMNSVLPLLTGPQFARLMGPADQIMWYSSEHASRRRAVRPDNDLIIPRGPLRLSAEQIYELEAGRREAVRTKAVRYLKDVDVEHTSRMTDAELYRFTRNEMAAGEELGLRSERALTLWAYLQLRSEGKIGRDIGLQRYLKSFPEDGTPDDKIYALMSRLSKLPDHPGKQTR